MTCGPGYTSYGNTCPADALRRKLPASLLPTASAISCYSGGHAPDTSTSTAPLNLSGVNTAVPVTNSCKAFPASSGSFSYTYSWAVTRISGSAARTGSYRVKITGNLDYHYDPCSYPHPCNSNNYEWEYVLAVAANSTKPCPNTLPSIANADPTSLNGCGGQFNGFVCGVTCLPGGSDWSYVISGSLRCDNG